MSDPQIVLSPQQETAILALLSGQPQRRAAEIAGVREETVSRWMNDEEGAFTRIYAARRADVWAAYESRIAEMVPLALGALLDLMRGEDHHRESAFDPRTRLRAAELVLQMAGLVGRSGARVFAPNAQLNFAQQQVNVRDDSPA